ncbi:hypothetical protein [Limnofasciculus baicalensis]|uniref:Uncharacterized protein n=1 Tax=Limnofasciculus baicalensis BBK-W-15 TaxID=2699891 RepID=A0AAE3KQ58_9CYAN|nr:hypothetical protein [Limnofasciculus baicalensis]MCP2732195.1 hypothetical protein [Limnofasciculus baicalensis BBK-W-15]
MQITIDLPKDLEQQLTLILETDDTPKAEILVSLHRALEDAQAGRVFPIEELWDVIDA